MRLDHLLSKVYEKKQIGLLHKQGLDKIVADYFLKVLEKNLNS